ncbi:MATE family efflux transporter [Alloalcanivorax xenomutans]|jgi:MATE family, multidrug efflux pump|uniref:MATE family efflux transporter n=1 Tax=Alloalcanivorax xenomutans TaxID=1094342 RepID=UPI001EFEF903|nr:MATE family efflux transporter [Alloalcanivorax xenomutans]MCE7524434.1 hypothetical protein [Alloalcanivorax xenomutans]
MATGANWNVELREMLMLGGSLALGQVTRVGFAVVSVIMMGWISVQALAAGALVNSVVLLLFLSCSGVLQGISPLLGLELEAGQYSWINRVMLHGVIVAAGLTAFSALILIGLPLLLSLNGQPESVLREARLYVWVLIPGFFPALWLMGLRYLLASVGKVFWLNLIQIVGVMVGIGGNYLLAFGYWGFPALGLMGIGLSTSLVNGLILVVMLLFLKWSPQWAGLAGVGWPRPVEADLLRRILRIGGPIGVVLFVETALFAAAHAMIGYIGVEALAAHAIAMQLFYFVIIVPVGLSQAATARVALAIGRYSKQNLLHSASAATLIAFVFVGIIGGGMFFQAEWLVGLVLGYQRELNPLIIERAVSFTRIAALTQGLSGMVIVLAGIARGYQDTASAMLYVLVGYWGIGLGCAAILAFGFRMEGEGIWWGMTAGFAFSLLSLIGRLFHMNKRIKAQFGDGDVVASRAGGPG